MLFSYSIYDIKYQNAIRRSSPAANTQDPTLALPPRAPASVSVAI